MQKVIDFFNKLKISSQNIEEKYKIPYLFTIAQAALESGWGKSAIGENLFGIKAGKNWTGKKKLITTTEYLPNKNYKFPEIISIVPQQSGKFKYVVKDWFRDYDNLEDCLYDHAKVILLPRYKAAFQYTDPYKFAVEIEKGGYATAPNYAKTINSVILTIKKYCST